MVPLKYRSRMIEQILFRNAAESQKYFKLKVKTATTEFESAQTLEPVIVSISKAHKTFRTLLSPTLLTSTSGVNLIVWWSQSLISVWSQLMTRKFPTTQNRSTWWNSCILVRHWNLYKVQTPLSSFSKCPSRPAVIVTSTSQSRTLTNLTIWSCCSICKILNLKIKNHKRSLQSYMKKIYCQKWFNCAWNKRNTLN